MALTIALVKQWGMFKGMSKQVPAYLVDRAFRIWDGHEPKHEVSVPLEYLMLHFPLYKLRPALDWLINNKIVGKRFAEFYKFDCGESRLHLHKLLLAKIAKEKDLSPVMAGKDFR